MKKIKSFKQFNEEWTPGVEVGNFSYTDLENQKDVHSRPCVDCNCNSCETCDCSDCDCEYCCGDKKMNKPELSGNYTTNEARKSKAKKAKKEWVPFWADKDKEDKPKGKKEEKGENTKGLTAKQKKLPQGLRDAIARRANKAKAKD